MAVDTPLPGRFRISGATSATSEDGEHLMQSVQRPRGPHDVVIPVEIRLPRTPELERLLSAGGALDPSALRLSATRSAGGSAGGSPRIAVSDRTPVRRTPPA